MATPRARWVTNDPAAAIEASAVSRAARANSPAVTGGGTAFVGADVDAVVAVPSTGAVGPEVAVAVEPGGPLMIRSGTCPVSRIARSTWA